MKINFCYILIECLDRMGVALLPDDQSELGNSNLDFIILHIDLPKQVTTTTLILFY